ncbi:MAG: helix-turn-helix domain-containing protein [Candidatus Acidiferrales bacterium]
MKSRPFQLGVRENTASSRQHAPRLSTGTDSNAFCIDEGVSEIERSSIRNDGQAAEFQDELHAASQRAGTVGKEQHEDHLLTVHEVAKLLQVPVSWVYGRTRKRSLERIPGYRLGKYWRFRQDEVLAWVESHRRDSHAA